MSPQISKALYRRIERWAPNIIKELPHAINPFGDFTTRTRNSSSVHSPDPLSNPSSSRYLSDIPTSEAPIISQSSNSPLSRMSGMKTFGRSRMSTRTLGPFISEPAAGNTQHQHQHESNHTQNMYMEALGHSLTAAQPS